MLSKRSYEHLKAQKEAKLRDRSTCQVCGRSLRDEVKVEAHHIVEHKLGGSANPNNLITLCSEHHKVIHREGVDTIILMPEK